MADNISVRDANGAAITLSSTDIGSSVHAIEHRITDATGTNFLPTMDASARKGFVAITNGTIDLGIFAEDAAHSSAHTGIQILAVRQDTPGNLSGTDGDYEPLQVSAGRLWCSATIDAALPAGTNAIGKLAANSGVDIGDVDVTSVVPGTGATNLGKAEDGAHTGGDVGIQMLGVRNDTHTTAFSGTDGDYTPIGVDSSGKVGIRGTFAEDAAHTGGDLGLQVLTVRQDTAAALSGTDADYQPLITDGSGRLHVNVGNIAAGTNLIGNVKLAGPSWTRVLGVSGAHVASADASGAAASVTDAPTAGQKIVVHHINVSVDTTLRVDFKEETSGTIFLRLYMLANTTMQIPLNGMLKLATADKKLQVQTSAAGNISVTAIYHSEA